MGSDPSPRSRQHVMEDAANMWLCRGNEAKERGAQKTAERYFEKSQVWFDRANKIKLDEQFRQDFVIATKSGRVLSRSELRSYVLRLLAQWRVVDDGTLDRLLDDPTWMRFRKGTVARAVAADVALTLCRRRLASLVPAGGSNEI